MAYVCSGLRQAGIEWARYSGHSFRIGVATAAAQAGVKHAVINMLGRWESAAYQHYVRTPRDHGGLGRSVHFLGIREHPI